MIFDRSTKRTNLLPITTHFVIERFLLGGADCSFRISSKNVKYNNILKILLILSNKKKRILGVTSRYVIILKQQG